MRRILVLSAVILGGALASLILLSGDGPPLEMYDEVLRADLRIMRDVIGQYRGDRGRHPESLEDLVAAGYLRKIPIDPFTKSSATWRLTHENRPGMDGPHGIVDVHSGARGKAHDGRPLASL